MVFRITLFERFLCVSSPTYYVLFLTVSVGKPETRERGEKTAPRAPRLALSGGAEPEAKLGRAAGEKIHLLFAPYVIGAGPGAKMLPCARTARHVLML